MEGIICIKNLKHNRLSDGQHVIGPASRPDGQQKVEKVFSQVEVLGKDDLPQCEKKSPWKHSLGPCCECITAVPPGNDN